MFSSHWQSGLKGYFPKTETYKCSGNSSLSGHWPEWWRSALSVRQSTPTVTSHTREEGGRWWHTTGGSCKSHPLKWRRHGRQKLLGHGLSHQLWFGIACFVEPWSCRGLLNSYRVKSPLQIPAFIYQRLVEWKYAEGWAFACWLWLILDAWDSFHDVVISYQKNPTNLNQPPSVTAVLCDQANLEQILPELSESSPGGQTPLAYWATSLSEVFVESILENQGRVQFLGTLA